LKNPKNEQTTHPKSMAKSRIWGTETPKSDLAIHFGDPDFL